MMVREIFVGLPTGMKEVIVETGSWIVPDKDYLLDVSRNPDGTFSPVTCGQSGAVDENNEFLQYLRARKMRSLSTSLTVRVDVDTAISNLGVADADVLVRGPKGEYRKKTDLNGQVIIDNIPAGIYTIDASKQHFHEDPEMPQRKRVEVLDQTCAFAAIYVRPESSLRGVLQTPEGRNAPNITVELVAIDPERKHKGFSPASYSSETDQDGRFEFENVFPGRYVLGTNIRFENVPTSVAPRAYYPGRLTCEEAAEILIEPGRPVEGLQFTLPDVGRRRKIRICVVDERGLPVKGADISDRASFAKRDVSQFGTLGEGLKSDAEGCAITEGFERASYSVTASTGSNINDMKISDAAEIVPGKGQVSVRLVLH